MQNRSICALTVCLQVVIMVMGLSGHQEGEGHDRATVDCGEEKVDTLAMPGCQTDLVRV